MKSFYKSLIICLIVVLLCSLCACESEYSRNLKRVFKTDYFVCINYEGENTVSILSLTKQGQNQEVLVIPYYINGMRVSEIGGAIRGKGAISPRDSYVLESKNIKKVYWEADLNNFHAINFANDVEYIIEPSNVRGNTLFQYSSAVYALDPLLYYEKYGADVQQANCFFYKNDEIVWIDYIQPEIVDESLYILPNVSFVDDEQFIGWFVDDDKNKPWSGKYVLPDGKDELLIYAKFKNR